MRRNSILLSIAILAGFALVSSAASATTITFSNYKGAASGNTASISQDGFDLQITAYPTSSLLTIGDDGLGVKCTGSRFACFGDDADEIDAVGGESIRIDFASGPVRLDRVSLLNLFDYPFVPGDMAKVDAAGVSVTVEGTDYFFGDGDATVDFGGVLTSYVSFRAVGLFYSDFSVAGLTIRGAGAAGPASAPPAVPEPSAALVFAAGAIAVGRRARRSRQVWPVVG